MRTSKYKITKYKGKTTIKDTKTGTSQEIDIESFMKGGYKKYELGAKVAADDCSNIPINTPAYFECMGKSGGKLTPEGPQNPQTGRVINGQWTPFFMDPEAAPWAGSNTMQTEDYAISMGDDRARAEQRQRDDFQKAYGHLPSQERKTTSQIQDTAANTLSTKGEASMNSRYEEFLAGSQEEKDYNLYNPYGGVDIPTAAFTLGQSIENKDAIGIVGGAGKVLLGTARNVFSGMGLQNRYNQQMAEANSKLKQDRVPNLNYENGGMMEYFRNGGVKEEDYATGAYMSGVENENTQEYNAEVEDGEYIKTNQGEVGEVVGKKHSQGGEKMQLEPMERILSDNLTIGQRTAKKMSDEYDIKLEAKHTYSDVIDKFKKKRKFDKILENEAEILKKIDDQTKVTDITTRDLNLSVLAEKKREIDEEKAPIEEEQSMLFERLFEMQESSKPKSKQTPEFEDGGMMVENLAREYGIDPKRAMELIGSYKKGGMVPKYNDGAEVALEECPPGDTDCEERNIIKLQQSENKNIEDYQTGETQSYTQKQLMAGDVNMKNVNEKLSNLLANFPNAVQQNFEVYQRDPSQGGSPIGFRARGGDLSKSILQMQNDINSEYEKSISDIEKNIKDPKLKAEYIARVKNEMFDDSKNRKLDGVLGDFTASRTAFKMNQNKGDMPPGTTDGQQNTPAVAAMGNQNMGAYLFPAEYTVPPTALQGTIKPQARFDRARANEVDIQPYLQSIRDREQTQIQNLEGLSPNVRAAVMANVRANSQNQESQIRTQVDTQNLGTRQAVEDQNTQIATREGLQQNNYNQGYESRIYRAQALTDLENRNYIDQRGDIYKQRFMDIHNLNLMNSAQDDIYFDGSRYRRKEGSSDRELTASTIDNNNLKNKEYQRFLEWNKANS